MNYATRIEVKNSPERDRLWDALRRLEERNGTDREQRKDLRFVDEYFDSICNYEDAAIITRELHHWRRLPAGASLMLMCGEPSCVRPSHMRVEVPKPLCRVCCEEEGLVHGADHGDERGN